MVSSVKEQEYITKINAQETIKTGIAYCDKLFHIEDQLKELPREERYKKRLELE